MKDMLKGKVAWVTGASSGMGEATALTFGREGAVVIVGGGHRREPAMETCRKIKEMGGTARYYGPLDVSDPENIKEHYAKIIAEFGRVDILAAFAGKSFDNDNLPPDVHWQKTMDVNMKGMYDCCMAVMPGMKEQRGGSIIICSSNGAFNPTTPAYEYHMAKGACEALAVNLALDGAAYGVRVNCIKPGCILTGFWDELIPDKQEQLAFTAQIAKKEVPLQRAGTSQDIANVALFFASELSSYVTGLRLFVGGGQGYIYSPNQSFLLSDDAQDTLPVGVR
ncbi:MAG: SDR family oxidoreductase [Oscillospiraceae bacterium]|nr:SDR family oxidoreductase [Oscillospiraceae bacterium]